MNVKRCDVCREEIVNRVKFDDAPDMVMIIRDISGQLVKVEKDLCDTHMSVWKEKLESFFVTLDGKGIEG